MKLNDLKSGWQNAGGAFKSEEDLQRMTRMVNHPSIKRIRTKLVIETIILVFFLFIYYDWFDGNKKPFYANLSLVVGLVLYIFNDVIGYISLDKPVLKDNLLASVEHLLNKVKRLSKLSLVVSFLYSVCLLAFFLSVITFTKEKSFILLGMILVLVQLTHISYKVWRNRILKLELQVKDFTAQS